MPGYLLRERSAGGGDRKISCRTFRALRQSFG
jgi:hypothetical protein